MDRWLLSGRTCKEAGVSATQEALIGLGRLDESVAVDDVALFTIVQPAAAAVDCQA